MILAGILLGIVNSIVRPIAILLTLPMTIVTLGLFLLVINAGMVALVAWMLPGMHVAGFWSAFWTSMLVSLVSFVGSWFVGGKGKVEVIVQAPLIAPLELGYCVFGSARVFGSVRLPPGSVKMHTPTMMITMPTSCTPDRCSCRNSQPRKAAMAGFT